MNAEQEWKAERELKDQEYERLQKAHTRLLTLQFEEKQHMMREHQEIIKALQTQFQEYRKTAEVLFKAEASKLEGQLHLQMEEYEEELKYVIAMKDQAFDDMIACKDAKILTLIEGTDFQQLLIRHELEKEQMRRSAVENLNTARREWSMFQQQHETVLKNKHMEQEAQIQALQAKISEYEDKIDQMMTKISNNNEVQRGIEEKHNDAMKYRQDQINKILQEKEKLTQEKFNLRHRLIFYKSKAGGNADESVNSVVIRMQKEMKDISNKFSTLNIKYEEKANEVAVLEKQNRVLNEKLKRTSKTLEAQKGDMKKLRTTFEKHLEKKASMATLTMVPKHKISRMDPSHRMRKPDTKSQTTASQNFPTVPEVSAVGGISPYVRREQRRQAKNRKARFEEHIRMLEKQALSKDMNSDK